MSIFGKPFLTGVGKGSASGAVANFTDGAKGLPLKSLLANIDPVQDLHGYDNPWPAGGGKNLLPMTVDGIKSENTVGTWDGNTYTRSGVTYTLETNASGEVVGVIVSGTAENNSTLRLYSDGVSGNEFVVGTEYSITSGFTGTTTNASLTRFVASDNITDTKIADTTFTWPEAFGQNIVRFDLALLTGVTVNGEFKPMIRLASVSDATFAPYSNICPISGWTEANVWRTGKNLLDPAYRYEITEANNFHVRYYFQGASYPYYEKLLLKKGVTYTFSFTGAANASGLYIYTSEANRQFIVYNKNAITFTPTEDSYGAVDVYWANEVDVANVVCQLELGSTATPYPPPPTPATSTPSS